MRKISTTRQPSCEGSRSTASGTRSSGKSKDSSSTSTRAARITSSSAQAAGSSTSISCCRSATSRSASASDRLIADVAKDRVERFPGFDKDEFKKMSEDDLKRARRRRPSRCAVPMTMRRRRRRLGNDPLRLPDVVAGGFLPAGSCRPGGDERRRRRHLNSRTIRVERRRRRERAGARSASWPASGTDDNSPHFDGRAQPGDVLGVETGGERTYVGDTSEDENKRRRDAEEAAAKRK